MLARRSFAAVLFLAVSGSLCSLLSAQTFSAETIGAGDRVVTIRGADLKRGATSLATVEAGSEMVATAVRGDWVGLEVERDGSTTTGWIHKRYLRRIGPAAKGSGKAITTAEEFRKTLDAMIRASREAIRADKKQYEPAPYVAFSLKVARQRIEKAGDDFRQSDPDVWRLAGINKVRGFVYDREQDDLILVGAIEPDRAPLTLDDLVVALRARLRLGEWPLVSIDPTPDIEKTQLQHVRYEGGIRGSLFALDLLTADYEMKGLGLGYVEAGVPDFRSHRDRWLGAREASASQPEEVSARFWFYPINPAVLTREGICAIQGLTVGVFTEVLSVKIDGKPVEDLKGFKDASGDAFAEELSRRFAELARSHYAFNRLRGLQELVGVSKALEQLEPRPDLSWWLKEYRLPEVDTPSHLPVARRRWERGRRITVMSGGVHLTALALKVNRGDISALRKAVLSVRPSTTRLLWKFVIGEWIIPLHLDATSPAALAALLVQADFLRRQNRHEDALTLYEKIMEAHTDSPDVWRLKGWTLVDLQRYDAAAECFGRALKLTPDCPDALSGMGGALSAIDEADRALECHARARELAPENTYAWSNYATTLAELGRHEEAIDAFLKSIELGPHNGSALSGIGGILSTMDRDKEAVEYYTRSIDVQPSRHILWHNLGCSLAKLRKYDEALASFDRALRLRPSSAKSWYTKGDALYHLGRLQEAKAAFQEAESRGDPAAEHALRAIRWSEN